MLELVGQKHKLKMPTREIAGIRFIQSTTAPTDASLGDEWYNTESGKTFKLMFFNNATQWVEFPSFSGIALTSWTTNTRPTNPSNNVIGYNTELLRVEIFTGGSWSAI